MHAPVLPEVRRLIDLIDYVEATERDKLKIELDYRSHRGFVVTEHDLAELPGVSLDCGDDDDPVWLRVERLAKIAPPVPADRELALWLSMRDDVGIAPSRKQEIATAGLIELRCMTVEDAPELTPSLIAVRGAWLCYYRPAAAPNLAATAVGFTHFQFRLTNHGMTRYRCGYGS